VDFLQKLAARADLSGWSSWDTPHRVLAVVAAALLIYWGLRVAVPAFLRLARPVLLLLLIVAAVWAAFPEEMCSMQWASGLPVICSR
jgi:uncharacterized membrane protein YphA (DoxX/SURF4 family)